MRKLLLIMAMLVCGCSSGIKPAIKVDNGIIIKDSINQRILVPFYSSVGIANEEKKIRGSGTIILNKTNQKMLVLTAYHVINDMKEIYVVLPYSKSVRMAVVKKGSEVMDLALLEGNYTEKSDGPYVNLSKTAGKIGDHITVMGCPMADCGTTTDGLISNYEQQEFILFYRISASVFFGNSGGGLFNDSNELIGVVDALISININGSTVIVPGGYFAISLQTINEFMKN